MKTETAIDAWAVHAVVARAMQQHGTEDKPVVPPDLDWEAWGRLASGSLRRIYVLGRPGTGKSFLMCSGLIPMLSHFNPKAKFCVLAFTHKACKVIRDYLDQFGLTFVDVKTIHSFCSLAPSLNASASRTSDLQMTINSRDREDGDGNKKARQHYDYLMIDEVGMIDDELARNLEECRKEGYYSQSVLFGDFEQLKPVNGEPAMKPGRKDVVERLTVIRRSDCPDIQEAINVLNEQIASENFAKRFRLKPSANICFGSPKDAEIVVAWTNRAVQQHNEDITGRNKPMAGQIVYCDTLKACLMVEEVIDPSDLPDYSFVRSSRAGGAELDDENDRFNVRERLYRDYRSEFLGYMCGLRVRSLLDDEQTVDPDAPPFNILTVYGTYDFKQTGKSLLEKLVEANQGVLDQFDIKELKGRKLAEYKETVAPKLRSKVRPVQGPEGVMSSLADYINTHLKPEWNRLSFADQRALSARSRAWSVHIPYKDYFFQTDARHARTVHACQGSSYDTVYVDYSDISRASGEDYARLMYVGLSRARNKIFFG